MKTKESSLLALSESTTAALLLPFCEDALPDVKVQYTEHGNTGQ